MFANFFDFSNLSGDYRSLIEAVLSKQNVSVIGMNQTEKIVASTAFGNSVLYITNDFLNAKKTYDIMTSVDPNGVYLLENGVDPLVYKGATTLESNINRIKTLNAIVSNKARFVVSSVESLFYLFANKDRFVNGIIHLEFHDIINLPQLIEKLVNMGYRRVERVESPCEFSIRGEVVDIYPINENYIVRIDLFDIQIQSIKRFMPNELDNMLDIDEIDICPCSDLLIDESQVNATIAMLEKLKNAEFNDADGRVKFGEIASEIITKLSMGDRGFNLDYVFPLLKNNLSTLFDYLPSNTTIVIDEAKLVFDALEKFDDEIKSRKKLLLGTGEILETKELAVLKKEALLESLRSYALVVHQKITNANRFAEPQKVITFNTGAVTRYTTNLNEFVNDVTNWIMDGYKIFIFAGDEKQARSMQRTLHSGAVHIEVKRSARISDTSSAILPYMLPNGFVKSKEKRVVIGTYDIFAKRQAGQNVAINRQDIFSVPKIGDYVVHAVHGIGICEGITKLSGGFGTKDYVVVRYKDNDKLYVPIDQMDLLDRFSGGETPSKLSKIGGAEFGAVKARVKKNLKQLAFDLTKLYAERETRKGFAFIKDDELQLEFENAFPYTETEDQLKAIKEIKADMESNKVMDRLLCGDLGFGKTEVALRAVFKAVLSGKQVALMAPTTILAEQHFNTCLSRFDGFGVVVGVLNKFRTPNEIKETLRRLKTGEINVICGTHRLLSDDVEFYDLGLIVLDEEQKFGVGDKEKLKLKRKSVDVLTLSATPIPRTLHMSLSGIRDVSIIATPPSERLPIQTSVLEYSDAVITDAINKELARDGQVFIVYNRVETIDQFAFKIRSLVPKARVLVGHGQMRSSDLETVMYKFYNRMADVLISTTIIENGVDMSNANTLIVIDADKFGLSQLYQIRGRVGRGSRVGYAYLMYKSGKVLTDESYKRLEAISEFCEFGSGFKIALRDLEIRGSGSVLGAEQHGHIEKVGYDLYCKMLNQAIEELKGNATPEEKDVLMRINIDAFIPDSYIESANSRMIIYKNISRIRTFEDREKVIQDTEKSYGKCPQSVLNLIDIAYTKALAKRIGVVEIYLSADGIKLVFDSQDNSIMTEGVNKALNKYSSQCVLNLKDMPTINFNYTGLTNLENFEILKDFLNISNEIVKK